MRLSVITINKNNASGLRKTIESVINQTFNDFEYIVVDGASDDGSVEVIKEFSDRISYWVSEADTGIYEAMNKGLRKSIGEYSLMLNSGDFLVDCNVIERAMLELDGSDIIQGNVICDYPDKTIRKRGYGRSDISFIDVFNGHFLHQASFCRKEVFDKYGYFDESYKKASDTYFFITCLGLNNATFKYIDIDISNFDIHGISSLCDPKWAIIDKEEDKRWFNEHIPHRLMSHCIDVQKKIKLYDCLKRNKVIWYLAMVLVRISNAVYKNKSSTI